MRLTRAGRKSGKVRAMGRKRTPDREIDLGPRPSTEGLEVIENDPSAEPAPSPPVNLLSGLPAPAEVPYAKPSDDKTGAKGIWTALEHL
jgi:hypothetical protein